MEGMGRLQGLILDMNEREVNDHIVIERELDGTTSTGIDDEWLGAWRVDAIRTLQNIEHVIDEQYIKLPVDADGVPWHIGDMVDGHGKVHSMDLNRHGWAFFGVENAIDPAIHRHAKPRTVEDAARDFVNSVVTFHGNRNGIPVVGIDDSLWRDYFPEFADELRELMGVDE